MPDSKKNEIALKEAERIVSNKEYDSNYANKQLTLLANGKYSNDPEMMSLIYTHLHSIVTESYKIAYKVVKVLDKKYPNATYKQIIDFIYRYQEKYTFRNIQRDLIIRIVTRRMKFSSLLDEKNKMPHTAISKALGFKPQAADYQTNDMQVESSQMAYVDKIIKLYNENVLLHNRVQLQVYTHEEKNFCYVSYPIDVNSTDVYSFVPTYLFALFAPKFADIENRMIFASISKIINLRKEGKPLETKSEVELFEDICRDPVETQCITNVEPFKDLYKRCEVQKSLWDCVLNLRNGKYSTSESYVFQKSLEFCKNVVYDNPEYAFVKDAGYDLQKLFNCFSFRPIIYSSDSQSVTNNLAMAQLSYYSQNNSLINNPMNNINIQNTVTPLTTGIIRYDYTPMVLVNPNRFIDKKNFNFQFVLDDKHQHVSIKDKNISIGEIKIENCAADILVFYVPRKKIKSNIELSYPSFKITELPVSMLMYEEIDDTPLLDLNYTKNLVITQGNLSKTATNYKLASAVFYQTTKIENSKHAVNNAEPKEIEIIIGSAAFVSDRTHADASSNTSCGIVYSPYNPVCKLDVIGGKFNPAKALNKDRATKFLEEDLAKRGTLFLYKKEDDSSSSCGVQLGTD